MRQCDTPKARAACTYSSSRSGRLGAQQAAQAGPAGQAQDHAQQEQAQIGARGRGVVQLGVVVDVDLHHQRAGRHQQHARNRGDGGVQVLDGVVDLALEIAGRDAEHDGRRQHGQRGQAADDQRRADALQGLPQHVVADAVGAQRVIAGGQPDQRARRHAQQNEGQAHGAPRQFAAPPGPRRRRPRRRRAGAPGRPPAGTCRPARPPGRPPAPGRGA